MLTISVKGIPSNTHEPEVVTMIVQRFVGKKYAIETTKVEPDEAEYRVRSDDRLKQDPTMAADIRKELGHWVMSIGCYGVEDRDRIEVTVTEAYDKEYDEAPQEAFAKSASPGIFGPTGTA
ncbi:hypothetical protein [Pseudomonas sp. ZL2]